MVWPLTAGLWVGSWVIPVNVGSEQPSRPVIAKSNPENNNCVNLVVSEKDNGFKNLAYFLLLSSEDIVTVHGGVYVLVQDTLHDFHCSLDCSCYEWFLVFPEFA